MMKLRNNGTNDSYFYLVPHLPTEVRAAGEEVSVGPRDPLLEAVRAPNHPHCQPLVRKLW